MRKAHGQKSTDRGYPLLGHGTPAEKIVAVVSDRARAGGMRLMLYPFGPKPLIFGASLFAAADYLLGTWYAYPIPRTYDLDYTVGVGTTYWAALTKC